MVDVVGHSPYWADSAIFIVEDDAQSGVDHIDGHRSTAFVVSPYVQRGQVNQTYDTRIDMVRTIEALLGCPTMNQLEVPALGMGDVFGGAFNPAPVTTLRAPIRAMLVCYTQMKLAVR